MQTPLCGFTRACTASLNKNASIHVKHFKNRQASTDNYALIKFLPDSIKEWRKIITYTEQYD